jgi:hypothetical protein
VNPVRTFDQITQEILDKYDYKTITVGILIADGNQTAARDYIINYMDKFDKESGKYIDFFVPGYCERISNSTVSIEKRYHPNAYEKWICMGDLPMFIIRRNQTAYYFDKFLFDDFIEEMETKMCIEYTYNPIDTINGATSSAIIYSIAETAKANNLKPYEYFEYLLTQIPAYMDDTDRSFLEDLLPWSPKLPDISENKKTVVSGLLKVKVLGLERLQRI